MNQPRCECHDCTQQRALEMQGTIICSNISQGTQCQKCGVWFAGTHICGTAQAVSGGLR